MNVTRRSMLLGSANAVRTAIGGDHNFPGDIEPRVITSHGAMGKDHLPFGWRSEGYEHEFSSDAVDRRLLAERPCSRLNLLDDLAVGVEHFDLPFEGPGDQRVK